jgi:anthranilate phosphoribosyltransferase
MDEISLFSLPSVTEFSQEHSSGRKMYISYQLHEGDIGEIQIDNVEESVQIISAVLRNHATEVQTRTVVINAAVGLMTFGAAQNLDEAMEIAEEAIVNGDAYRKLNQLIETSNRV